MPGYHHINICFVYTQLTLTYTDEASFSSVAYTLHSTPFDAILTGTMLV